MKLLARLLAMAFSLSSTLSFFNFFTYLHIAVVVRYLHICHRNLFR